MTTGPPLTARNNILNLSLNNRNDIMAQSIPGFIIGMVDVTDGAVQRVRKNTESPPRVSVYNVIGVITGMPSNNCSTILQRWVEDFRGEATTCGDFKFACRGQRYTPVTDAESTVTIIMLLPGRAAAPTNCMRHMYM